MQSDNKIWRVYFISEMKHFFSKNSTQMARDLVPGPFVFVTY